MIRYIVSYLCRVASLMVMLVVLVACRFGDDVDELNKLSTRTRKLSYSVTLGLPTPIASSDLIRDLGSEGLVIGYGDNAEIAVMGKEFQTAGDAAGAARWPYPEVLTYSSIVDAVPVYEEGCMKLSFDFAAYGKHSIGEEYATDIRYLFPADKAVDRKGEVLKARVDSVPFDFTGQDGTLATIRSRYYAALGTASALCRKSAVVMRDSAHCLIGHDHASTASEMVLMDPKVAIVRLSLVVPAQQDYPLLQYLSVLKMNGVNYYVEKIEVNNGTEQAAGISKTNLNLNTGWMETTDVALSFLSLTDEKQFWQHEQIMQDEAQSLEPIGGSGKTWGTLVYVAIPCVQQGVLDTELQITVHLRNPGSTAAQNVLLYGTIQPTTLYEGGYYITSPVKLYEDKDRVVGSAQIVRVP